MPASKSTAYDVYDVDLEISLATLVAYMDKRRKKFGLLCSSQGAA